MPGLVDQQQAALLVGLGLVPDVIEHDVHGDRTQFVLKVAQVEHHHRVVDVDVALLAENAGKGAAGVFTQALGQLRPGAAHVQQRVVEVANGWRCGGVCQRVVGDAGFGVGFDQCGVEVGLFARRQGRHHGLAAAGLHLSLGAAHHQPQQAVQCNQVAAQGVVGLIGIDNLRQVERVDPGCRIEAEPYIGAADGIAHPLVFVLGVDDEDLGAEHHAAQSFQLDAEAFTGPGLGEYHRVAVFQREAVKDDQAGIVHIDAVEDAVVLAEVGAGERETGAQRAGAHVAADLQLVDHLRRRAGQTLLLL